MNLKTTLILLVLTVAGGAWFWLNPPLPRWLGGTTASTGAVNSATFDVLEKDLTPDKLKRIEVRQRDRQVVLEKGDAGWTLPGKWPTRQREVEELAATVCNLRSRFVPIPVGEDVAKLKSFGLDAPAVVVVVRAGDKDYRLSFGEEPGQANRFSRTTYLRVADKEGNEFKDRPEVVRLAPGIVALLDRPLEFYQQRRLFPSERVAKENEPQEKTDRLNATSVSVKGPSSFTIQQIGEGKQTPATWEITEPARDTPDPEKLQSVLVAVPDIWAEHFVTGPKKDLAEYGLDKPQQTLSVKGPAGNVTLLVGKESPRKGKKKISRPQPFPGAPPLVDTIDEKYNYAKLEGNDQIFEIRAEKLKDVFVGLDALRDARVARFRTDDVNRIEVKYKDAPPIILVKKDKKFLLEKPIEGEAEASRVLELVDRLSQLEAKGPDVHDKADAKEYSFDPPVGMVELTLDEDVKGGDAKTKRERKLVFQIGKHEAAQKKLFVRLDGFPRVNGVDDSLLKLVDRQPLAYRNRTLFDFADADVAQIDVQRGEDKFTLKRADKGWQLTAPSNAVADPGKTGMLADKLAHLAAVDYVADMATDEELDKTYGLTKPAMTFTLTFKDAAKPAQTIKIGKAKGAGEFYAKLDRGPQVFVLSKETVSNDLDHAALSYLPTQLWQVAIANVNALRIARDGEPEYTLKKDGANWKLSGPFEATIARNLSDPMVNNVARLQAERYEAQDGKELEKYGLDKPHLKITVVETDKDKKEKEQTILIGKATAPEAKARFAKLAGGDAIFVVGEALVSAADHSALDLLDKNILKLDEKANITKIKSTAGDNTLTLEHKGDLWKADTGLAKFDADRGAVAGLLTAWSNLRADRFAAYGSKLDLAKYGLDKPARTITISEQPEKPEDKPVEHTLLLGKAVDDKNGERYAKLADGAGVVVLDSGAVAELDRGFLDFVDRTLLDFDSKDVTGLARKTGEDLLELVRREDAWHIAKPAEQRADDPSLVRLTAQLAHLRAQKVVAYPAKDLKPYGLDDPAAVVTLRLSDADGKPREHVLKIGEVATDSAKTSGDRYVQVDGGDKVAVLPGVLVKQLVAKPLAFRDKAIAKFVDADKVILERGSRKAVFARIDGNWKQTEPVQAEAEQTPLDDFINALARLRADELVSDKPEDLKPFGLEKPEIRWQFFSGDKEVLSLLVGDVEKNGTGRHYAKLADGDLVFLLDPKLTERALAEYRSRTLWSVPLDAAQAVHLDYTSPGDPARKAFALAKLDNSWQLTGKPDTKVKQSAVNDTLAAIAALRAERTVVDKDADLKLYGLEPPQIVVEARTQTGVKRLLQIGSPEGESKRRYARLTEGNRTDVFVISEADAARLVRDLAAFTEK